jgi:lysophospholipase L1-like esterase
MGIINAKTIFLAIAIVVLLEFYNKDTIDYDEIAMLPPQTKIVAFGDSITFGYRVDKDKNYPSKLSKLLGAEVFNQGVNGEQSFEGLKRLPAILEKYKPQILVICHGGNDILRKKSLVQAKENIANMIKLARAQDIHVILIGVPKFEILSLATAQMYYELASELDVPLEDSALETILNDSNLKLDNVHPNEQGYELLSISVAKIISDTYLATGF